MKIEYNKVTWYSQVIAIIIFVGTFYLGFYVGRQFEVVNDNGATLISSVPTTLPPTPEETTREIAAASNQPSSLKLINNVTYFCPAILKIPAKNISAQFYTNASGGDYVDLELSDGRTFTLPHAMSADGARYANPSESFVFWNKGSGAFILENGTTTFTGCATK